MKKILLAVLLIGTMTAFGAAPQAQEQKPPMQVMHMTEMMKACPMNVEGADIAISDTPNGIAITFSAKSGNVEATDVQGETALVYAAGSGNIDIVSALLKSGAKKGIAIGYLVAASKCHDDIVNLLLERGVEVNAKDEGGLTAPVAAAMGGCAATIKMLAAKGADLKAANSNGFTPLIAAAFTGSRDTMQILLDQPVDVNAADKLGRTALMGAAVRGMLDIVQLLLAKGADPTAHDHEGRSAAGYAAIVGEQEVVKYFQSLPK